MDCAGYRFSGGRYFHFQNIFAAVARKDAKGFPEGWVSARKCFKQREQTLRGMTIWAAKANFEEQEKRQFGKRKNS